MKKKILIIIIIIAIAVLCCSYMFFTPNPTKNNSGGAIISDNGTLDNHQDIWKKYSNVELSYANDGTHFDGTNNESNGVFLVSNKKELFINPLQDFTIEMDFKTSNLMAFYFIQSLESNGNTYIIPDMGYNKLHHLKFAYSKSTKDIDFFIDGKLKKTVPSNFTDSSVGFKIIDWQGDMDIVISNVTVYNK